MQEQKLSDRLLEDAIVYEATMQQHLEQEEFGKAEIFESARDETFDAALAAERQGT